MKVTVLHNPRCSKSREMVELLKAKKVDVETREYLKDPLSEKEILELLDRLPSPPAALVRTKEAEYDGFTLDRETVAKNLAQKPVLMERPVVILGDKAVVARPVEKALELIER